MTNRLGHRMMTMSRAMPAARATHEPSPSARSRPAVGVAIARGPSDDFIRRGRNPEVSSPWRFEPTVKGENDVVI